MKQNLFLNLNPLILDIFSKNGKKTCKIGPFTSKLGQNGPDWFENVQNRVFLAHFEFFQSSKIFLWEV